jgi:outer membrane protein
MKKTLVAAAIACVAAGTVLPAQADQGDLIVRVGATLVDPDTSSDPIVISEDLVLPGGVDVDDDTQLGLNVAYMFHQKFGLEVLAATPFEHDIQLVDAPVKVGSTKHLPPTVTVNWFPFGGGGAFQPYIGAGINYTTFFQEDTTGAFDAALGDLVGAGGPVKTKLKLDDSWGWSAQIGADLMLGDNWMINGSVRYIEIGTEATVSVPDLGAKVSFDVDIDPWVYTIAVGYKF